MFNNVLCLVSRATIGGTASATEWPPIATTPQGSAITPENCEYGTCPIAAKEQILKSHLFFTLAEEVILTKTGAACLKNL